LRGNVLPVGGIKEKVLAARRARVSKIILPNLNKRDREEIPQELFGEIKFVFVDHVREVFKEALKEKAPTQPQTTRERAPRLPQAAAPRV
jgi:ATP-dependent Lon protease